MNEHFAVSLPVGSSLVNRTGAWRTERPQYVDLMPPCNNRCPAGENIQQWLYHAEEGNYRAAWEEIMLNNPFPAIMGRACYHPCEDVCNRATLDAAVNIHAVERFLGDQAISKGWKIEPPKQKSGPPRRVLVIGAGPSGLSAAYHLARFGHRVTIVEAGPVPGGMMRFGIPAYRLPRDIVNAEIQRILDMGVTLRLNEKVDDIPALMKREKFDACFVAIGAHLSKRVDIPSPDASRILDALGVLRTMESSTPTQLGRRVIVYGGGNTALDVARTAKRMGHEAIIVYRRTREKMPAHDFEVEEAAQEGIQFRWLETIKHMSGESITVEKMALDANGFPQPTGEFEVIEGDMVVLALGQDVDTSALDRIPDVEHDKDGVVKVGADMMTGHAGIFAGGDMVPSERTITVAAGHGKKAARNIDVYLQGQASIVGDGGSIAPRVAQSFQPAKHALATFDKLNTWYYSDAEKTMQPVLDLIRRQTTFGEVIGGLDETNALFEARRCMSCGNCFECDNCFAVCPDNAVVKLGAGKRFEFNFDYCKGCGVCVAECPCGAIEMVPEDI